MTTQPIQEWFLFQLSQMYAIEQRLVQVFAQLAQEMQHQEVQQAFLKQQQVTHEQVRSLEHCFQLLGYQPVAAESHAVDGLKQDHDAFVGQQQPTQNMLTFFDLRVGRQCEYLQMPHYQSLIESAQMLGYLPCIPIFQENLQQDVAAAQELASLAHQLAQFGVAA